MGIWKYLGVDRIVKVWYTARKDNITRVFLHGHQIATIGENFIQLFDGNRQSNTTKSRLNAILAEHGVQGEHVFQKNFEWFVRTVQGACECINGQQKTSKSI